MIVDLFQELWICFFLDESWLCMLMCLFPTFQHGFPTTSQISHIFCVAFNLRFSQGYTTSACWNENSQVLKRLRNHGKSNGLVPFSKSRINNKSRAQQRLLALDGDHGVCCQRILPKCKGNDDFFQFKPTAGHWVWQCLRHNCVFATWLLWASWTPTWCKYMMWELLTKHQGLSDCILSNSPRSLYEMIIQRDFGTAF